MRWSVDTDPLLVLLAKSYLMEKEVSNPAGSPTASCKPPVIHYKSYYNDYGFAVGRSATKTIAHEVATLVGLA